MADAELDALAAKFKHLTKQELQEYREIFNLVDKVRLGSPDANAKPQPSQNRGTRKPLSGGRVRVLNLLRLPVPNEAQDGGGSISADELADLMETLGIHAKKVRRLASASLRLTLMAPTKHPSWPLERLTRRKRSRR